MSPAKVYARGYSSKQLNHLQPGDWFYLSSSTPVTEEVFCVVDTKSSRCMPHGVSLESFWEDEGNVLVFDPRTGALTTIGGGVLVFLLDVAITFNRA